MFKKSVDPNMLKPARFYSSKKVKRKIPPSLIWVIVKRRVRFVKKIH